MVFSLNVLVLCITFYTGCAHGNFLFESVTIPQNIFILLQHFDSCHLKYYSADDFINYDIITSLIKSTGQSLVYSHETSQYLNNIYILPPKYSHQRIARFSQCFIHCYEFNSIQTIFPFKMFQSETSGEKPNHFLFFENINKDEKEIKEFYKMLLPNRFAMGLLIRIVNISKIDMICLSCEDEFFYPLENSRQRQNLKVIWQSLHSNLHEIHIMGIMVPRAEELDYLCENFKSSVPSTADIILRTDVCVHKILGANLNYTAHKHNGHNTSPQGEAILGTYISEPNVKADKNRLVYRAEWTSHAIRYTQFKFVTILTKPAFDATALVEPFEGLTWLTLVMSCVILSILTVANFKLGQKFFMGRLEISKVLTSVIASILDQPTQKLLRRPASSNFCCFNFSWLI